MLTRRRSTQKSMRVDLVEYSLVGRVSVGATVCFRTSPVIEYSVCIRNFGEHVKGGFVSHKHSLNSIELAVIPMEMKLKLL